MQPLFITDKEGARLVGVSRSTLQKARVYGGGPPFITLTHGRVVYFLPHFLAYYGRPFNFQYEDRIVTEAEVAEITGLSRSKLQKWRVYGGGPPAVRRTSSTWGYWLSGLFAWIRMFGLYRSTSQEAPDPYPDDPGGHECYYKWIGRHCHRLVLRPSGKSAA